MKSIDKFIIHGLLFILWLVKDDPADNKNSTISRLDVKLPATPKDFVLGWLLPGLFILGFAVFTSLLLFKILYCIISS